MTEKRDMWVIPESRESKATDSDFDWNDTCKSKYQIIGILLRNGEKVPKSIEKQLYKRLDALDAQIFECEMEYKEIVTALTGENRRKEHGNRIQRHGRTEQE